jgi:hypothetical protein
MDQNQPLRICPNSAHGRLPSTLLGSRLPKQEGGQTPGSALGERPSFSITSLGYAETRPRLRLGLGPNRKGANSRGVRLWGKARVAARLIRLRSNVESPFAFFDERLFGSVTVNAVDG